jgi:uncharacterized C2H2 Zn-finger protein
MTQKGEHTWDLVYQLHRCPECGSIFESRRDYSKQFNNYVKDLECPKCHHAYTLTKKNKSSFGPIFGEPQPKEVEWS